MKLEGTVSTLEQMALESYSHSLENTPKGSDYSVAAKGRGGFLEQARAGAGVSQQSLHKANCLVHEQTKSL